MAGASEAEIEQVYRRRYAGFGRGDLPIAGDWSLAADAVQEGFARALHASGVVRRLTGDALEQCSRLGRLPEGATPPPDGATTVTDPAVARCREQVVGHLPPFPKPG